MKKCNLTLFAIVAMTAGLSVSAQANTEIAASCANQEACAAAAMSADEQAFVAKLNDSHKKIFSSSFNADQRTAAMALKMSPNDAVSKVMKDNQITAEVQIQNKAEPQLQAQSEPSSSPVEAVAQPVTK